MITEELKHFIKESIARGVPVNTIRTQLTGAGWPTADIEEGLKAVAPTPTTPAVSPTPIAPISHAPISQTKISHTPILGTEKTHSKNHTALWISGIIVLVILSGVGYMYSQGYFLKKSIVEPIAQVTQDDDSSDVLESNSMNTYENTVLGISFKYSSSCGVMIPATGTTANLFKVMPQYPETCPFNYIFGGNKIAQEREADFGGECPVDFSFVFDENNLYAERYASYQNKKGNAVMLSTNGGEGCRPQEGETAAYFKLKGSIPVIGIYGPTGEAFMQVIDSVQVY